MPPEGRARAGRLAAWPGKRLLRTLLLFTAAALVAALASWFGIAHDFGYLRASILSGIPGGEYHALAMRLAARAREGRGALTVVPTAGSVENIGRLTQKPACSELFAIVQDGTPVPVNSGVEVLGRLPEPESLILLGRRDRPLGAFADLRGAVIGVGPEQSGTAYLMRQLFEDQDLRFFDVRLVHQQLESQAELVARGELDFAAFVIREDAEILRKSIRQHGLDVAAPRDIEGLVARHPWLSLGRIPAGYYDLVRPTPAADRPVARIETLVVSSACARRADRVAILTLLAAELPGFTRVNPPRSRSSMTALPIAAEAREFFVNGQPELADRYFPWLVNLFSPAYWVYLLMAVTIAFKAMKALSRFRLWRIDASREKLEGRLQELVGSNVDRAKQASLPAGVFAERSREKVEQIGVDLAALRTRCQRQVGSMVTPMGDEMFYRYQEFRIDEALEMVASLLGRVGRGLSRNGARSEG